MGVASKNDCHLTDTLFYILVSHGGWGGGVEGGADLLYIHACTAGLCEEFTLFLVFSCLHAACGKIQINLLLISCWTVSHRDTACPAYRVVEVSGVKPHTTVRVLRYFLENRPPSRFRYSLGNRKIYLFHVGHFHTERRKRLKMYGFNRRCERGY